MNPPGFLLFNFDVGSAQLKLEHREMLHAWVVPHLKCGHSVTVVGLTSRTGSAAHNQQLSWMRCQKTLDYLRGEVGEKFAARPAIGFGELKAKAEGHADNSEDPRFRSVVILVGPGEAPPFPPALFDVTPIVPRSLTAEESSFDIGQLNDVISGISQFLELMPWEKLAIIGENVDLFTAVVGPAMAMPMLWKDVGEQNETNGLLQGFWEAMQDMSARYSDPALSTTPLSRWPPLACPRVRPLPPLSASGLNEREWMAGKNRGCQVAYEGMQLTERKPSIREGWEITGRRHLFLLSQKFGTGVGAAIRRVIDSRLQGHGKSWPLSG